MDPTTGADRTWSPAAASGRLNLPPWSNSRSADETRLAEALKHVDPEVLINCESTGVGFWDGVIPDPVDGSTI